MTLTVTFKLGTDPDKAQQLVQNRVAQAEPRLPEEVRRLGVTTVKSAPDLTMVVHLLSPNERYDMTYLRNYARAQRQGPARAHRRAWARCCCSARGDYSMRVWLDPQQGRASAACRRATWCARSASRTCRPRPASSARRPDLHRRRPAALGQRAGPAAERGGVRRHHRQDRAPTARSRACATSRASSSAPPTTRCARCSTTSRRWRSPIFQAPGSNAIADLRQRARARWPSSRRRCPRAWTTRSSTTRRSSCAPRSKSVRAHAARGDRAGRAGRDPVPADLARLDHPAARGAGLDRRHVRGDATCSASRSTR